MPVDALAGRRVVITTQVALKGRTAEQKKAFITYVTLSSRLEAAYTLSNFIGLITGIAAAEAVYCSRSGNDPRQWGALGPAAQAANLKIAATFFTLLSVVLLCSHYYFVFRMQKAQGLLLPSQTFVQTRLLRPLVLDFVLLSIHCPAGVNVNWSFEGPMETVFEYDADSILSLFMFLRLKPFIIYLLRRISGFQSAKAIMLGSSMGVHLNAELAFRYIFRARPVTSTLSCLVVLLVCMAYFITVSERLVCSNPTLVEAGMCQNNLDLGHFSAALWFVIVTATTVGFGDVTPVTTLGRAVAVVCAMSGICVIALMVNSVTGYFTLDPVEASATTQLEVSRRNREHKLLARDVIRSFLLLALGRVRAGGCTKPLHAVPQRYCSPLYRALNTWLIHKVNFTRRARNPNEISCLRDDVRCLVSMVTELRALVQSSLGPAKNPGTPERAVT